MRKLFYTFVTAFLVFFLLACGAEKQSVAIPKKTVPTWYSQPPLSNGSELYAIGEGKDKKEAIANALNFMVSTLSVSISSSYNAKTVVKEGKVNSSEALYSNEVQSDIAKIRISNYELLQAKSLGFKRYAVLIKSNKKKLFESMLQEIKQNIALISEQEVLYKDTDGLKKLQFYKNARTSLENLPNTLLVMSALSPTFDGSPYLYTMQDINTKYEETLEAISFSIESDTSSSNLKDVIAKGLSAQKFQIKMRTSNMHYRVYIKSSIQKASSYGFTLARSEVSFVTKQSNGVIVGSNVLNIVGQSSQGYAIAKQNIAVKLSSLIEKEGIGKIMGLDI